MELIIIAAVSENNVIGANGKLPWHISDDLKRFRSLTLGHPVIMGRKTFESIGRPLDKRLNVVITNQKNYKHDGVVVVHSMKDALAACRGNSKAFAIGGKSIFEEALPVARRLELTRVHKKVDGDAFFPEVDWGDWKETARFSFVTFERK
jgi:dihydrofolate reductase